MPDLAPVEIQLSRGRVAYVSAVDAERVRGIHWVAGRGGSTFYAYRSVVTAEGRKTTESMHRMLTAAPKGLVVDHVNGNGLDNRRENLRVCTHAQNIRNQVRQSGEKTSRFKGVWARHGRWYAMIQHNGEKIGLGAFREEDQAARQYDRAARLLFGPFAKTNASMGLFERA